MTLTFRYIWRGPRSEHADWQDDPSITTRREPMRRITHDSLFVSSFAHGCVVKHIIYLTCADQSPLKSSKLKSSKHYDKFSLNLAEHYWLPSQ
jgi:hypothetical protein